MMGGGSLAAQTYGCADADTANFSGVGLASEWQNDATGEWVCLQQKRAAPAALYLGNLHGTDLVNAKLNT